MIPAKNLFSGALGRIQNVGGSKFFTTPHTVNIPVEYQITTMAQNNFVACSLDGRLWMYQDYCIVLRWNESTLRMQILANIKLNNEVFITRGIDWILTQKSFIQVLDESPFIFKETVNFENSFTPESFYSFLPPVIGWQIIGNFIIRRYGNPAVGAKYSLNTPAELYLTHRQDIVYGKDSSKIGIITISYNDSYSLEINPKYSFNENITGLAFLGENLFGFIRKQDNSLYQVSTDCRLFSPATGTWQNVFNDENNQGNIYFDPFNYSAIAIRDNQVNLLPDKKIFAAKGISQWFAPTGSIEGVTNDFVITRLEHDILATHLNSGLYRENLYKKDLALSSRAYSGNKLSIGAVENVLKFNQILMPEIKGLSVDIELVNIFETDFIGAAYDGFRYHGSTVYNMENNTSITYSYKDVKSLYSYPIYMAGFYTDNDTLQERIFWIDGDTGIPYYLPDYHIDDWYAIDCHNEDYLGTRYTTSFYEKIPIPDKVKEYKLCPPSPYEKLFYDISETNNSDIFYRYNISAEYLDYKIFLNSGRNINYTPYTHHKNYLIISKIQLVNNILLITLKKDVDGEEFLFTKTLTNTELAIINKFPHILSVGNYFHNYNYYDCLHIVILINGNSLRNRALSEQPAWYQSLSNDDYYKAAFLIFRSKVNQ